MAQSEQSRPRSASHERPRGTAAVSGRSRLALTTLDQWRLSVACEPIREWLDTPFLVGSVWERRDPGDIDVRVILADDEFDALFDARPRLWSLLCLTTTAYLEQATGLPVDFQVQRRTEANEKHPGPRSALGLPKDVFAGGGDGTPRLHPQEGQRKPCIGNDPTCPCQDGDLCHYVDDPVTGTKAMLVERLPDER